MLSHHNGILDIILKVQFIKGRGKDVIISGLFYHYQTGITPCFMLSDGNRFFLSHMVIQSFLES